MSQPSSTDQSINTASLITQWRLQILNNLLWVLAVFGGLALIIGSWSDYLTLGHHAWPYITVYALTYGIVVGAAALRQLSLNIRAILMLIVLGASSTFLLIFFGLVGSGRLLWISVIVLALVYFGLRGGIITLAISCITLVIAAALYISGNVGLEVTDVVTVQDSIEEWAGSIFL
ncbi:MAG: STAS domain-containing protein, partial [Chloroflexi bacterium]